MPSILDLQQFAANENAIAEQNNPLIQIAMNMGEKIKEKKDKERRQQNIKDQMETYNQMMQLMAGMGGDISDVSKAGNLTEDKVQQRRSNIVGSSTMIPSKEFEITPDGLNLKLGFKSASPTDQKNLIDIEKTKSDMAREESKRQFLSEYIKGNLPEGAFLQEMGNLGLTPEEFDSATQARNRLQSIGQNMVGQNMGGTPIPMGGGQFGQMQGGTPIPVNRGSVNQPPEGQVFDEYNDFGDAVYRPMNPTEEKAKMEIDAAKQADQIKTQATIDTAQGALNAIKEIEDKINFFGPIEGRIPAMLNPKKIEWQANVNNLTGRNIVNLMNEMKSQSRTGATGFGQLNRAELKVIEDASMVLKKEMDEKTALKYLNQMKRAFQRIIDREQNGYEFEGKSNESEKEGFSYLWE